jgi:hypothetical protein
MEWGALASLLKICAALAVGVPLAAYFFQDQLIFHPPPAAAPAVRGAESLSIEADDGTRLHAWHVRGAQGAPLILYFGGNAEDVSWMVGRAAAAAPGTGWLLVDYRGYGASDGKPSETALVSDALAWFDYAKKSLAAQDVVVFGRSLGSGVAVQVAAARTVSRVILVAPYDSLVSVAQHHYPFLPVSWLLRHRFDSAAAAPHIRVPLLCLVAERDEVIPVVHSKGMYDAWAGPKRWVELEGAGHNSTDEAPAFWEAIKDFLVRPS